MFYKISLLDELSENLIENNRKISDLFQVFLLICKSEKNKYVCIRYGIRQILFKIISKNSSTSIISLLAILLQIVSTKLDHESGQYRSEIYTENKKMPYQTISFQKSKS